MTLYKVGSTSNFLHDKLRVPDNHRMRRLECAQETDDLINFGRAQRGIQLHPGHQADRLGQGGHPTVMEIRSRKRHITEHGNFEDKPILFLARDLVAAQILLVGVRMMHPHLPEQTTDDGKAAVAFVAFCL